jgi:hypothetical protein
VDPVVDVDVIGEDPFVDMDVRGERFGCKRGGSSC